MGTKISRLRARRSKDVVGAAGSTKQASQLYQPYDFPFFSSRCFPRSGGDAEVRLEPNARRLPVTTAGGFVLECVWVDFRRLADKPCKDSGQVLVHFHGNGELACESACAWAPFFHETLQVQACLFVEYRGYGNSSGTTCLCEMQDDILPAVLNAVDAAWSGMPAPELMVYGRSIGTIFALAFAARFARAVVGLVLESGMARIPEWVTEYTTSGECESPAALFKEMHVDQAAATACAAHYLDASARLKMYQGPLLVLHAAGDTVVRPEHAQTFHGFAGAAPERRINRMVIWDQGDHATIHVQNMQEYGRELHDFAHTLRDHATASL